MKNPDTSQIDWCLDFFVQKWKYFKATIQQLLSKKEAGKIYRQRKIDVEPAFGYLKAGLGFTRFSVLGSRKTADTQ